MNRESDDRAASSGSKVRPMRTLEAMDLGPKLTALSAREWERRPRELRRRPYMHHLARGAWVRSAEPLSVQQRSVLLREHLERHRGQVAVTGLTALEMLNLPVGHSYGWEQRLLGHAPAPRAREYAARSHTTHLAWNGTRLSSSQRLTCVSKSLGLPGIVGPWDCPLTHPVEALVVAAPVLPLWRITACVDALMSLRVMAEGRTVVQPLAVDHVGELLNQLPQRAQSVVRVRQALKLAQGPTISAMETLLRLVLLTCGLPPMETNHPVMMDGKYVYPDLAWPAEMVALEYNGRPHWENGKAYGDENYRIQRLRDHGWQVRVVVLNDLRDPKRRRELLQWLFQHLDRERARRTQSPLQHLRGR
ncbi:hypothetical protein [Kocuria sp. cx-455]|uniref:hypothetical protein n=1 Tax=Kocuria sp. cx-455 TaxID=2771377 RepID=UPI003D71B0A2